MLSFCPENPEAVWSWGGTENSENQKVRTMKTQKFLSVLVALVVLVLSGAGCITKSNVVTTGSSPRFVPGTTNVVYETFEHRDRTLRVVQPEWSGGGGGNIFRFRASVGGAPYQPAWVQQGPYGYGGPGYHPPVVGGRYGY